MCKKIIRTGVVGGVIAGAAIGATVLIAGPERSAAIFDQLQDNVLQTIDSNLKDPVALRAQLRELENEYPERISGLRGDLGELQGQIHQLEREKEISERVVALAQRDLEAVDADSSLALATNENPYFHQQTQTRSRQIRQTQAVYSNRASEASHDLVYLRQQETRMLEVLAQLETEYSTFQAQLWQLERQVDAIARNERLIELMEDRQKTIDELSRFEVVSLDHMVGRLAEMRSRQEAELEMLANDQRRTDYESLAKLELDEESRGATPSTVNAKSNLVKLR
jgi:hypothetical protein